MRTSSKRRRFKVLGSMQIDWKWSKQTKNVSIDGVREVFGRFEPQIPCGHLVAYTPDKVWLSPLREIGAAIALRGDLAGTTVWLSPTPRGYGVGNVSSEIAQLTQDHHNRSRLEKLCPKVGSERKMPERAPSKR